MSSGQVTVKHNELYMTATGMRRVFGIYAPVLDRFIFFEQFDLWSTLELAEILSSKIQVNVLAFCAPDGMTQDNCACFTASDSAPAMAVYPVLSIYSGTPKEVGMDPAAEDICRFAQETADALFELNYAHALDMGDRHMTRKYLPTTFDCTHLEPLAASKRALYQKREIDA